MKQASMMTAKLPTRRGGSALIVVLWVVGILSLFVGAFAFDAHVEARLTSYYRKRTKAEYLARSGVEIAEMLMAKSVKVKGSTASPDERKDDRWFDAAETLSRGLGITGTQLVEPLGDGTVTVELVPEPARRNINNLGATDQDKEANLERILEVGGIPEDLFPKLVESFLDWTDPDDLPRVDGAETDDYYATLEKPYKAKNGPLDTTGELLLVKGFNRKILFGGTLETGKEGEEPIVLSGIDDLLTTYGDGKVNVNAAGRRVLMTLPGVDDLVADAIIEEREGQYDSLGHKDDSTFKSPEDLMARIPELPPEVRNLITTGSTIYRITSTGDVGGVKFQIWCIVEKSDKQMTILRWREETDPEHEGMSGLMNIGKVKMTGVVAKAGVLEWTALAQGRDGWVKSASGALALPLPSAPAADGSTAEAAVDLTALKKEASQSGLRGVVTLALASDQLLMRVVSLPDVPEDELTGMVQLQVDKMSPFPVETMVVSHEVLHRKEGKLLVLVAAVREDIVRSVGTLLARAGLKPGRVDAALMGRWQTLKDADAVPLHGGHMALLLDGPIPEAVIFLDGVPVAFRSLGETEGLDGESLFDEMSRALSYTLMSLEMEHGGALHGATIWCHGDPPQGLVARLTADCQCEVQVRSLDQLAPVSEGVVRRSVEEGREWLDLTPVSWRSETDRLLFRRRALTAGISIFGAWALLVLILFGGGLYQQFRLKYLKAEQERWHKKSKEVAEMRRRVQVVNHYMDNSRSALECLREICERLPGGVSLSSFSYRKGEEAKLSGEAPGTGEVYEFKKMLDESKIFSGSQLTGPHRDARRNLFVFDVDLKLPGGDSP